MTVRIYGEHDDKTVEQLKRCVGEEAHGGVLMADGHFGYSMPVGGVVAYPEHVSPSGVGYDIACGNKAVLTDLTLEQCSDAGLSLIADEINRRISFGMGRRNNEPVDHPVFDEIRDAEFPGQRALLDLAVAQLGTVGAGNHYVDLFADEHDRIWIGVHFGSRGFGHKTASGFLSLAAGGKFEEKGYEGEMEAPPTLIPSNTDLGQAYLSAMELAGDYAYAGRDVVCEKVLEILGAKSLDEVHNHHNYAWYEPIAPSRYGWVVRKGATPAFPGQRGFIGSTMGEDSVIVKGTKLSGSAYNSTVHGAGRRMSRTKAAGKKKAVMECTERDCHEYVTRGQYMDEKRKRGLRDDERFSMCPNHPDGKMQKRRKITTPGLIDWDASLAYMKAQDIELRGAAADEAPGAYKRLDEVLGYHEGQIEIEHTLRPLVVVMAGPDVHDSYKD